MATISMPMLTAMMPFETVACHDDYHRQNATAPTAVQMARR